ncbi:MAG: FAD-dependent oxidoreductase [Bacteroidetes bacterium]|nr:FAD-dependent oxidoreductase [Bacteroidota bacterium]
MLDFLIIGQGIAGSVLARMLEKSGRKFHIVQSDSYPSASRVAAGVWNPIVVKRFAKTWLADETIPAAKAFFSEEEDFFQETFFISTELIKLLSNENEKKQMEKRWEQMMPFVEADNSTKVTDGVEAPFGILRVKEAGYSRIPAYLDACRKHWIASKNFIKADFQHRDLKRKDPESWEWNGQTYKQVVFCEGIAARNNPWMKDLPLSNTKGQVLELSIPDLHLDHILNKQLFVLPQKNGNFRVGSTYEWNTEDLQPSEEGKAELLSKLQKLLPNKKFEVVQHEAGGRPTTSDRRPLMGALAEEGLFAFNGLGSRGVLLVPYLAFCMLEFLNGKKTAIPDEARLQRFA